MPKIIRRGPSSLLGQSENFTVRAMETAGPLAFVGRVGGQYCSLEGKAESGPRK
jgi:hypothetical protein